WTWDSAEPFGWVVFHYGRWVFLADTGWCWVQDTEWGPAWVSFRNNEEYIGWAPLPPEARFLGSVGFSSWVDAYYDIGPDRYCFVPFNRFCAPRVRTVLLRGDGNLNIFATTV